MSKAAVKALIDEKIYENGEQKITGPILNNVLNTMVDEPALEVEEATEGADLELADETGKVLARFANGGLQVKNFDSSRAVECEIVKTF